MTNPKWHTIRADNRLTLTRRLPARLDVVAQTRVPLVRLTPLAHQIRQDVWRLFRQVRGFSPVVVLDKNIDHVLISTGGRVEYGPVSAELGLRLTRLLDDPDTRARWIRWAT